MNEGRDNAGKLFLIQQFGKYGHQDGRGSDAGSPFGPRTPSRRSHDAMSPSTQPSRKSTEPNLSLPAPKPMRATHSFSSLSNDRSERLHIDPDIRVPAHPDRRHSPLIQPNQLNATNSTTTPNPTPKNLDTASSAAKLTDTASATSFIVTQEDSTEFVHNTSTDQSMPPLESLAVDADVSPRPSGSSTPIWKRRGAPIIRHEVFFDDNASVVPHPNKRNIVDVRWLEGDHPGEQVEMDLFAHRYVVRVSPLMAILDPHYFINEVHEVCRRTRHADKDRGVVRTRRSTLSGPLPSTLVETLEQYVQQAGDKEGRDLVISRTEDSLEVARDEVDSTSHASSSS
ncbi:hypothetical protein SARC_02441 [Sphaeroforma arctica JP610]|uniref:Uncharacterized protein n=1 Tax=Sphaeroforma arctica JP610 TaxID=667725 RepID=A0A0L0GAT8_9EUKA|nr:hypothetical protein SARC_02441 [Sphaeroforma arctica JP610]KNC85383.1 hypothetical protein SARC_02441 [Sphaeroforma arctica JP610]|eukprot:XP_014159285.1 hypothetical protein SARC_02441 [Sphaeroforma arctica JP610]